MQLYQKNSRETDLRKGTKAIACVFLTYYHLFGGKTSIYWSVNMATVIETTSEVKGKFKNRSRTEIFTKLLNTARNGTLKTHLMLAGNLSYDMLNHYLGMLIQSELIREERSDDGSSKTYRTTEKGYHFLRFTTR
jgi:predicted transcriptional regulator